MFLLTKPEIKQLIQNGQPDQTGKDHVPVAKLYIRGTGYIWLLTELNPENLYDCFGLYDLNNGDPVLGRIDFSEIKEMKTDDYTIERDPYFVGKYPISFYEKAAKHFGYITEVDVLLNPNGRHRPPGYKP